MFTFPATFFSKEFGRVEMGIWKSVSGYSGDCMDVRRSSDNVVASIPFSGDELFVGTNTTVGSLLHHVTNNNTEPGNSGFVTRLYEQSGTNKDAIQTLAASQPRVVNAGTVETADNGKPGFCFDGTDDWMFITDCKLKTELSMFTVGNFNSPNFFFVNSFRYLTQQESCYILGQGNGACFVREDNTSKFIINTSWMSGFSGVDAICSMQHGGGNMSVHVNSVQKSTTTSTLGNTEFIENLFIGLSWNGFGFPASGVHQTIILDPDGTTSGRSSLETRINNFYSIF